VERVYGHLRAAGIFELLAFGSALAELALFDGGVGLSGVGYGLWGMLWVLERRDLRFAGAVDRRTSQTFVVWFFVCIGLTVTKVMPVANVAHGVGAVMGALLGWMASGNLITKVRAGAALAAILILSVLGSTVFWRQVNLSGYAEAEIEQSGLNALERGDNAYGTKCLEMAVQMRNAPARAWYNLGIAYGRLGRAQESVAAFKHAAQMPDASGDMRALAQQFE
jgi:predicted lipid-binding transport protein (Tim44 family)